MSLKIWTEKQNHCQLGLDLSKALSVFLAGVGAVRCRQECWPGNADRQPDFIQVVHRNYSESEVTRKLMLLIFSIHIRQVLYRVTFSVVFSHPYSPKRQFQKKNTFPRMSCKCCWSFYHFKLHTFLRCNN